MSIRTSIWATALLGGLLAGPTYPAALAATIEKHGDFKVPPAPARDEGEGPYSQLILRSATVINGTGAPAFGPADIDFGFGSVLRWSSHCHHAHQWRGTYPPPSW